MRFAQPNPIHERRNEIGFTLIELLVVVAVILIIAAIAVPNFLRSKMAANESSAAENVRTITTAATVYSTTWDNGYPPNFITMGGNGAATCDNAILVDNLMASAPHQTSGYTYSYAGQGAPTAAGSGCTLAGYNSYVVSATPIIVGSTGQRSFCSTEPAVIHYDPTGAAITSAAQCDALPALNF